MTIAFNPVDRIRVSNVLRDRLFSLPEIRNRRNELRNVDAREKTVRRSLTEKNVQFFSQPEYLNSLHDNEKQDFVLLMHMVNGHVSIDRMLLSQTKLELL